MVAARHRGFARGRRGVGGHRPGCGRRGRHGGPLASRWPPALGDPVDVHGENRTGEEDHVGDAHPPIERLDVQPRLGLGALGAARFDLGAIVGPALAQRVLTRRRLAAETLLVFSSVTGRSDNGGTIMIYQPPRRGVLLHAPAIGDAPFADQTTLRNTQQHQECAVATNAHPPAQRG